jgi:hypothetical protein
MRTYTIHIYKTPKLLSREEKQFRLIITQTVEPQRLILLYSAHNIAGLDLHVKLCKKHFPPLSNKNGMLHFWLLIVCLAGIAKYLLIIFTSAGLDPHCTISIAPPAAGY